MRRKTRPNTCWGREKGIQNDAEDKVAEKVGGVLAASLHEKLESAARAASTGGVSSIPSASGFSRGSRLCGLERITTTSLKR